MVIISYEDKILTIPSESDVSSWCYYLPHERILIDLGNPLYIDTLIKDFDILSMRREDVKSILYTHLHFDHIGVTKLFPNASVYVSKEELDSFKENPYDAVWFNYENYKGKVGERFIKEVEKGDIELKTLGKLRIIKRIGIDDIPILNDGFFYLVVPGHTKGSTIFIYDRFVFIGDFYGSTDTPTSCPETYSRYEVYKRLIRKYGKENIYRGHEKNL